MPVQIDRSAAEEIVTLVEKAKDALPEYASQYAICKSAGVEVQQYRNARFTLQGPNSDHTQDLMCIGDLCCEENGSLPAVRMMPQSSDQGRTVEMVPCCANHASDWWDGADWDGRHLEADI